MLATKKYVDYSGLTHLIGKIKVLFNQSLGRQEAMMTTTAVIADNSEITIPLKYQVGNNSLFVYCLGEKLVKVTGSKDGHYKEVGTTGSASNKIRLNNIGQSIPVGTTFEFVVFGNYD